MAELKYLDGTGLSQVWNKIKELLALKANVTALEALEETVATLEETVAGKAAKATTLAGYGITDAYTKAEIDGKLTGAMHYKGQVASYSALPSSGNVQGDVWNVESDGHNYAWNGTGWDKLAGEVDLSDYATISWVNQQLANKVTVVSGKGLSTNDYTTTEKNKLSGIEASAQVNKIESVVVNGVTASISGKQASVTIPVGDTMVALTSGEIDEIIT